MERRIYVGNQIQEKYRGGDFAVFVCDDEGRLRTVETDCKGSGFSKMTGIGIVQGRVLAAYIGFNGRGASALGSKCDAVSRLDLSKGQKLKLIANEFLLPFFTNNSAWEIRE